MSSPRVVSPLSHDQVRSMIEPDMPTSALAKNVCTPVPDMLMVSPTVCETASRIDISEEYRRSPESSV